MSFEAGRSYMAAPRLAQPEPGPLVFNLLGRVRAEAGLAVVEMVICRVLLCSFSLLHLAL